ncbi:MAG: hypothetical protein HQL48_09160 [Gammaproteobacteria bacterium]|nr:hypothetical protein [Gammaproteobacteria bacterium]
MSPMVGKIIAVVVLLLLVGCDDTRVRSENRSVEDVVEGEKKVAPALATAAVVAINIEHPTAKLYYKGPVVTDMVTAGLSESGLFKVIDWSRLSSVLFRRNLEWSDVTENSEQRQQIQDLLLNDYFLTGSISAFTERMEFGSSALSKERTQIAQVHLELFLKDAFTNEIILSSSSEGRAEKKVTRHLGFGMAGGTDTTLAYEALSQAIHVAIEELEEKLSARGGKDHE